MREEIELLLRPFDPSGLENPYDIISELQKSMQANAMIARTAETLSDCLKKISELQDRATRLRVNPTRKYNPGWHAARDVHFMLKTSEINVRCDLERSESQGAHWRLDFPELDAEWGGKDLIARKGRGEKL